MNTGNVKALIIDECLRIFDSALSHGYKYRTINKHLLKPLSLSGGRQVTETKEKMKQTLEMMPDARLSQSRDALREGLISFIKFGEKFSAVLDLSVSEAASLIDGFDGEIKAGNPFKKSFPHLPKAGLVKEDVYYPAFKLEDANEVTLFFGSKRRVRERVDIDPLDLSQQLRNRLKGLTNVAAYTLDEVLNIDAVVVNKESGKCELRISDTRGLSSLSKDEAVTLISRKVKSLTGTSRFVRRVNFHPCIMPLYNDKSSSDKVTKFYFEVDENGMKKEYKPHDKKDLRDEKYHGSGSQAIGYKFRVFAIRKVWEFERSGITYSAGVEVTGSPRVLDEHNPEIFNLSVHGCFNKADYDYIMSKVMPFSV